MTVDRNLFFKIQTEYFSNIPFDQTEEWLQSTGSDENIHFFVNNVDKPDMACWGRFFKRRIIGNHLIIDGTAIQTENIKTIRDFFQDIVNQGYSIIEVSDIGVYTTFFEIGIRQAGFVRPILSLSPLSLIVKTQEPFNFQRNWKRNVKKALEAGCEFEIVEAPSEIQLKEFVELFNQLKIRKGLGFSINDKSLYILLKNKSYKMFFVKDKAGKYISGRILYVNSDNSYDVYAANSDEGIRNGAAYYIQECVLQYLKEIGVSLFDYGRISPSNDEMNNIYVAKNYSGGEPIAYNGQWLYSKNIQISFLYEFYKFLIRKQRRY
ncbi:MAG TPA: hypothetical protein P5084_02590 [Paludibacter sp.]|nr:hypothetical protein [Paludibacter sp.]